MSSHKKKKPVHPSKDVVNEPHKPVQLDSNRRFLIGLFVLIVIGGGALALALRPREDLPQYKYEVLRRFPHDTTAFTQGLWINPADNLVYESTGKYGFSTIRKVDLETGDVIESVKLDPKEFGEGLAFEGGRLVQLTWNEEKAIVWSMDLKRTGEFPYEGEGWGLAFDGENFVTSNGTGRLFFRDKETFKVVRHIDVTKSGRLVGQLNELEITGGKIYANRLYTDWIYVIDPNSGKVVSEIDLEGLWPLNERPRDGVLNGIAVNPKTEKMIVTGKYCPYMYELELKPVERN